MTASAAPDQDSVITGVRDPRRLRAVAEAELGGHLADPDLDAVVKTLCLASGSPIAVVNIVTVDQQTYASEVGIEAECSFVSDELSFCAQVVETGEALTVTDAASHHAYRRNPLVRDGAIGSYAGVPLIDDGVVLGSVAIFDRHAREFSPHVLEILHHQGRLAGSVLALRRSARTDALTGLPNRAVFMDRLALALARLDRTGGSLCVMYLDVDNFKTINDTLGHSVGDQLLIELARRLTGAVRDTDTVARLGGDEFAILCETPTGGASAEELAARITGTLGGQWALGSTDWPVTASIGFATADAAAADPSALLAEADAHMYAAKRALRSRA